MKKLKQGDMYICPTTSSYISYDWFYTEDYIVILLSVSVDILRMIMKKDFAQRKEVYEDIALYNDAGNQSPMDNACYKVLEKILIIHQIQNLMKRKVQNLPVKIKIQNLLVVVAKDRLLISKKLQN